MASPVKPASERGVSKIRCAPNSSNSPPVTPINPHCTSSPRTMTAGSRRISSAIASWSACVNLILAIDGHPSRQAGDGCGVGIGEGLFVRGKLRSAREGHGLLDLPLDIGLDRLDVSGATRIERQEVCPQPRERVLALPRFDLIAGAVGRPEDGPFGGE